jgi:cytochrome b561
MTISDRPQGYTVTQIALHWAIAGLVIIQLVLGEDIVPAYRALRRGMEASATDLQGANIHIYIGFSILALAAIRLVMRQRHGVPEAPVGEGVVQRWLAALVHILLYAAIFIMPVTGALAWFLGIAWLGEVHEIGKPVIIVAVIIHAAGALWQHLVARTDVLVRMLKPRMR